MSLTREEVKKVALLSRLELSEDEIDARTRPLNDLLQQFVVLQSIDVTGIGPTSHSIPIVNVFREDVMRPSLTREEVLANAPESRDGCFVVPKILSE